MFLAAPIIYFFTGIAPLSSYSEAFYWHAVPFIVVNEIAFMFGMWGVWQWEGKASYLSFFSVNLRALWTVLKGEKIKFPVTPKERQEGNFLRLVIPQIIVAALTIAGFVYACYRVFTLGMHEELPSLMVNAVWAANNVLVMLPMIRAATWSPPEEEFSAGECDVAQAGQGAS